MRRKIVGIPVDQQTDTLESMYMEALGLWLVLELGLVNFMSNRPF